MVAAALVTVIVPAAAVFVCQPSKGGDGHWSWRIIDGKRCWYPGKRSVKKSDLQWSRPKVAAVDPRPLPTFVETLLDPVIAAPLYQSWTDWAEREKLNDIADEATRDLPRYPDDPDPASVWPILTEKDR